MQQATFASALGAWAADHTKLWAQIVTLGLGVGLLAGLCRPWVPIRRILLVCSEILHLELGVPRWPLTTLREHCMSQGLALLPWAPSSRPWLLGPCLQTLMSKLHVRISTSRTGQPKHPTKLFPHAPPQVAQPGPTATVTWLLPSCAQPALTHLTTLLFLLSAQSFPSSEDWLQTQLCQAGHLAPGSSPTLTGIT